MDGAISFNGVIGVLILYASIFVFAVIVIVNLISRFVGKKTAPVTAGRPKNWLFSAVLFLAFDVAFLIFLMTPPSRPWEKEEAVAFDDRMLMIWIPCHLVGFFLISGVFYLLRSRGPRLDKFIEKLRK